MSTSEPSAYLCQVSRHAGRKAALRIATYCASSQGDNRHRGNTRIRRRPNLRRRFVPRHLRHLPVHQAAKMKVQSDFACQPRALNIHEIKVLRVDSLHCGSAIRHGLHLKLRAVTASANV